MKIIELPTGITCVQIRDIHMKTRIHVFNSPYVQPPYKYNNLIHYLSLCITAATMYLLGMCLKAGSLLPLITSHYILYIILATIVATYSCLIYSKSLYYAKE